MMNEERSTAGGIVEARLRIILCSLAVLVFLITPAELVLLEHTEDWQQLIPFVSAFFGLVASGWVLVGPSRRRILGARTLSAGIIFTAAIGLVLHLQANFELELEIQPGTTLGDVWLDALFGPAPLLAPGILLLGALLVLGATYTHPSLSERN